MRIHKLDVSLSEILNLKTHNVHNGDYVMFCVVTMVIISRLVNNYHQFYYNLVIVQWDILIGIWKRRRTSNEIYEF